MTEVAQVPGLEYFLQQAGPQHCSPCRLNSSRVFDGVSHWSPFYLNLSRIVVN
jgi:hypothetical protein